jgi:hypothetical protein
MGDASAPVALSGAEQPTGVERFPRFSSVQMVKALDCGIESLGMEDGDGEGWEPLGEAGSMRVGALLGAVSRFIGVWVG